MAFSEQGKGSLSFRIWKPYLLSDGVTQSIQLFSLYKNTHFPLEVITSAFHTEKLHYLASQSKLV